MSWRLSFWHRPAETLEELREVIAVLEDLRRECDEKPGDIDLLRERNGVFQNIEGYASQYVAGLLDLVQRQAVALRMYRRQCFCDKDGDPLCPPCQKAARLKFKLPKAGA